MEAANHMLIMGYLILPIVFIVIKLIQFRKENTDPALKFDWLAIFNMSIIYAIAFNMIFFIQELFLALGKKWLGLTAYLYHNNHDWEGSHELTSLMQGSGALAIVIVAVIVTAILFLGRSRSWPMWLQLLLVWIGFQGFVQGLTQLAFLGPGTDMDQSIRYFEFGETPVFIISVLTTIVLILVMGFYFLKFMDVIQLKTVNRKSQIVVALKLFLIPAFIGCIWIIPFRIMPWDKGFMQFASSLTWMPWMMAFPLLFSTTMNDEASISIFVNRHRLELVPIILFVFLLLCFQLILAPGVVF